MKYSLPGYLAADVSVLCRCCDRTHEFDTVPVNRISIKRGMAHLKQLGWTTLGYGGSWACPECSAQRTQPKAG